MVLKDGVTQSTSFADGMWIFVFLSDWWFESDQQERKVKFGGFR